MTTFEEFRKQIQERNQAGRPLTSQEIDPVNNTPEAKSSNIILKNRNVEGFQKILLYLLAGFLLVGVLFAYSIYDGRIGFTSSLICGNVSSSCPEMVCPNNSLTCPNVSCPPCNLTCDFPNKLEVVINQTE